MDLYRESQTNTNPLPVLRRMLMTSDPKITVEQSLMERTRQVSLLSTAAAISLPILGAAPLFETVRLYNRTTPNWAVYNLSHDPLWGRDRYPIPREHLQRLNQLHSRGIEFDALYVAHELPEDFHGEVDDLDTVQLEPAPPLMPTQLAHGLGGFSDLILKTYAAAARQPLRALSSVRTNEWSRLYDPLLLGAIIPSEMNPEDGVPAVWFLLAVWRW